MLFNLYFYMLYNYNLLFTYILLPRSISPSYILLPCFFLSFFLCFFLIIQRICSWVYKHPMNQTWCIRHHTLKKTNSFPSRNHQLSIVLLLVRLRPFIEHIPSKLGCLLSGYYACPLSVVNLWVILCSLEDTICL